MNFASLPFIFTGTRGTSPAMVMGSSTTLPTWHLAKPRSGIAANVNDAIANGQIRANECDLPVGQFIARVCNRELGSVKDVLRTNAASACLPPRAG
jgi:hypothetical protein